MTDTVIWVQNISKCYQIYETPHDRLKQLIIPKLCRVPVLRNFYPSTYSQLIAFYKEFWALKNVSLEFADRFPNTELQIHQLQKKVNFLYARAALPAERWRRLPQALRNLATLRYHRYGRGLVPFINDLAR